MNAFLETAAGNPENQDRGAIIHSGERLILCIADGAGGLSGGTEAACLAIEFVRQNATELQDAPACVRLLQRMDQAVAKDAKAGETTCAVAVAVAQRIFGASVGDSGVWFVGPGAVTNLTERQARKPLIGSGIALPVVFESAKKVGDLLLLATDGLLKYTSAERIANIANTCRKGNIADAARQLIELVRYPSGALPDDVTVIVASEHS
jgi:serine/threonine protein phosphatase PrpC